MEALVSGTACCWTLPLLVLTVALILTHTFIEFFRVRKLSADGLHCSQCCYPLQGLGHRECPECGQSLGEYNSLLTRRNPKPFPIYLRVLLLTTFIPIPAFLGTLFIAVLLPSSYQYTYTYHIQQQGFSRIRIVATGNGNSAWKRISLLTLNPQGNFDAHSELDMPSRFLYLLEGDTTIPLQDSDRLSQMLIHDNLAQDDNVAALVELLQTGLIETLTGKSPPYANASFALTEHRKEIHFQGTGWVLFLFPVLTIICWINGFYYFRRTYNYEIKMYLSHWEEIRNEFEQSIRQIQDKHMPKKPDDANTIE